jgi:23S rRNA (guanosine2251-2'-O)-methyltransferase
MERMKSRPKDRWHGKDGRAANKAAPGRRPQHGTLPEARAVYGLHAAEAALANPKRKIRHAYLTENAAAKLGAAVAGRGIASSLLTPPELDALLGRDAVHQGAVLDAEPLAQPGLDEFLDGLPEGEPAALAMLDQVTDPHNVGAVLRSAAAFGIAALIVQDRHSPPLTGTLAKAASGAAEHVPIISTVNLARALERLKEHGFECIGFDSDAEEQFSTVDAVAARTVFVFGAEDKGLRRLVREGCDALYALSAPGKIKSLNISNAAAIVFYEAAKAHCAG